jgi:hypothetical protein
LEKRSGFEPCIRLARSVKLNRDLLDSNFDNVWPQFESLCKA